MEQKHLSVPIQTSDPLINFKSFSLSYKQMF